MYNKKIFKRCFSYPKKYWYRNIKEIPLYFKQMHFLIKNGYDKYATWETFDWFIHTMKSILIRYKETRVGTPIIVDNYPWSVKTEEDEEIVKRNDEEWDKIINRMIELLDKMDEDNFIYENMNTQIKDKTMEEAKKEFFDLFSEHFYNLWD